VATAAGTGKLARNVRGQQVAPPRLPLQMLLAMRSRPHGCWYGRSYHRDCGGPLRMDGLWQAMAPPLDPPRKPILKCFLYLNDVGLDQGPTAVLRGSHRLPWAPDGIYDLHGAGYRGFAGAAVRSLRLFAARSSSTSIECMNVILDRVLLERLPIIFCTTKSQAIVRLHLS
jgi:hypothetical protein